VHPVTKVDGQNPEVETHLYRILQESLNNVVKHAEATRVSVKLERKPQQVALVIKDDGRGFDASKTSANGDASHGLGLLGMRERATLVGGNVEFESVAGAGSTVIVSVPL
jgi:signal transduction histidine kinase